VISEREPVEGLGAPGNFGEGSDAVCSITSRRSYLAACRRAQLREFKSPRRLEVELRPRLRGSDRALLVWMTWLWPSLLGFSCIVQPDTILRWHRAGFRAYWRWKSRGRPGISSKPRVPRHREPEQLSSTVAHHEKRKQTLECQRRTHAEIDLSDSFRMVAQECPPGL
jgi:hypothetical protein